MQDLWNFRQVADRIEENFGSKPSAIRSRKIPRIACVRFSGFGTQLIGPGLHNSADQMLEVITVSNEIAGKPFKQFIKGWLKQKPPAEILGRYGNWPEPHLPKYDKPFWGFYKTVRENRLGD